MPTVNVYYSTEDQSAALGELTAELKAFAAEVLTCNDIQLNTDEITVRLIQVIGSGMLADIELEITAHAFNERIEKQDKICLNIRKFLKQKLDVKEVRVWLLLPQLGHSWE